MCNLETPSAFNRDVPDLDDRISKAIPPSLLYAVCHWQNHLPDITLPSDLVAELDRFLREKLLFWLELLSLLGALNHAAPGLESVLANYPDATGASCKKILRDTISFIRQFGDVIALAATHVYIFALPCSPLLRTILGNLNSTQLNTFKNDELLAFHQDAVVGTPATPFNATASAPVTSPPEFYSGTSSRGTHVFIINTGSTATKTFEFANVPGLGDGSFVVHDMWTGDSMGTFTSVFSIQVDTHDTAALLIV